MMAGAHDRNRRRRGQSLVEIALVAPLLVVMLVGAAQVGSLAFGLVSIDTAAREGARAGAIAPNTSAITYVSGVPQTWYTAGTPTHQCTVSDFTAPTTTPPTSGNPICLAALDSRGTMSQSLFTSNPCASASQACVTISVIPQAGLRRMQVGPPVARLYGTSSCNGANATVTGVVSGMPSGATATVTDATGDTQPTDTSGNFSICVRANNQTTTQTLTAQVGPVSCGGYSGALPSSFAVVSGGTYPNENITVSFEGACPPPPPTPTPTPVTCSNQQATVTGVVTVPGLPPGQFVTVTASTGETATADPLTGAFTICVKANGSTNSQTLVAQIGSPTCGGYFGSVGPFAVTGGGTNPNENLTLAAESACPTPSVNPAPGVTCSTPTVPDSDYFQVTITYPSPIFVPFIGGIFQSQPGFRTITTTVTDAVEPCSFTLGN
jgi:hypothetical protein